MTKTQLIHHGNVAEFSETATAKLQVITDIETERKGLNDRIGDLRTTISSLGFCPKAVKHIQQLKRMTPEQRGVYDMTCEHLRAEMEMEIQPLLPYAEVEEPKAITAEVQEPVEDVHVERGIAAAAD